MYDLVIRGGTVVDGLGHDPISTDVAVKDGRIAKIGAIPADAAEVVDAGGLALMPGIIDLHTHYDAQVTWDPTLSPSPSLGVTTAVMGNCGFGIVPSPPLLRDMIMRNLAVVEGMDLDALVQGTRWEFESFAEYLDALERLRPYANVGVLAGHSTIRTAVMGEDASTRKAPTADEMGLMTAALRDALKAGAAGFASSFSPNHSGWGGRPMLWTWPSPSGPTCRWKRAMIRTPRPRRPASVKPIKIAWPRTRAGVPFLQRRRVPATRRTTSRMRRGKQRASFISTGYGRRRWPSGAVTGGRYRAR